MAICFHLSAGFVRISLSGKLKLSRDFVVDQQFPFLRSPRMNVEAGMPSGCQLSFLTGLLAFEHAEERAASRSTRSNMHFCGYPFQISAASNANSFMPDPQVFQS
jgi:hypothetical protein